MLQPKKKITVANRPEQFLPTFSVVLVLGLVAFIWLAKVPISLAMALVFTICATMLIANSFLLSQRLALARAQRDRSRTRERAARREMHYVMQKQDHRIQQCVNRHMQELEHEMADLRQRERLLEVQAHHDGLTGLANRILLTDRFRLAIERAKRACRPFALLMVDLNHFKVINDNHGHSAGDTVLVASANRLVGSVRASDTVARLGGDEFVLIIESFEESQELVQISEKLIAALSDPITLKTGTVVSVGASIGMAMYPDQGVEMNELLFVADQAMYHSKSSSLISLR